MINSSLPRLVSTSPDKEEVIEKFDFPEYLINRVGDREVAITNDQR